MGILIKNMEMPNACYACVLSDTCDLPSPYYVESIRPHDCPLQEVKSGEWIPYETQVPWGDGTTDVIMFRCSICGYEEQDWQSKFCPNCGADMRGKKE